MLRIESKPDEEIDMKRAMTVKQAYDKLGLCYEDRLYDIVGCMDSLDESCKENGYVIVDGILWKEDNSTLR